MKKIIATLLSALAISTLAITSASAEAEAEKAKDAPKHWSETMAVKQYAKVAAAVPSIKEEQKPKIVASLVARNVALGKVEQLKKSGGSAEEVKTQRTAAWQAFMKSLKETLNEEQFGQYQAAMKKMKSK